MLIPGVYTDGIVNTDASGDIVSHASGLPYTESGAIAIGSGPATHYCNGLPFDSGGRLAVSSESIVSYQNGFGFDADGNIVIDGVATAYILDANAAPNTISEISANGLEVGITAQGVGFSGPVTYSLTSNPGSVFAIDSSSGVVTVADYGGLVSGIMPITVQGTDGVTTASRVFYISVLGENAFNEGFDEGFGVGVQLVKHGGEFVTHGGEPVTWSE